MDIGEERSRKRHEAAFKRLVTLAAARGDKTLNELTSQFGVHGTLIVIGQWKRRLLENLPHVFEDAEPRTDADEQARINELHRQIGIVNVELACLKKKLPASASDLLPLVDSTHPEIPVCWQREMFGLPRLTWYYEPASESDENLALIRQIDGIYLQHPTFVTCHPIPLT